MGERLNIYITVFLLSGTIFGLVTYSHRHLFSEGPKKIEESTEAGNVVGRILWMLICTFLWPILILTGLNSLRILSKRNRNVSSKTENL